MVLGMGKLRAKGPANRQTGGLTAPSTGAVLRCPCRQGPGDKRWHRTTPPSHPWPVFAVSVTLPILGRPSEAEPFCPTSGVSSRSLSIGYLRGTSVVPPKYLRSTSVCQTEVLRTYHGGTTEVLRRYSPCVTGRGLIRGRIIEPVGWGGRRSWQLGITSACPRSCSLILLIFHHCPGCVGQFHSVATFIAGATHLGQPMVKGCKLEPSATTRRPGDPRAASATPLRFFMSQIASRARDRRRPGKRHPAPLIGAPDSSGAPVVVPGCAR